MSPESTLQVVENYIQIPTISGAPPPDSDCDEGTEAGRMGVSWPSPRFTDNGNGTVTDNLTGLIWLKHASCYGKRTWADASSDANALLYR